MTLSIHRDTTFTFFDHNFVIMCLMHRVSNPNRSPNVFQNTFTITNKNLIIKTVTINKSNQMFDMRAGTRERFYESGMQEAL